MKEWRPGSEDRPKPTLTWPQPPGPNYGGTMETRWHFQRNVTSPSLHARVPGEVMSQWRPTRQQVGAGEEEDRVSGGETYTYKEPQVSESTGRGV